jgi:urea carboxylase
MGGFINPYTVPSAAFWKLGQAKPGDILHFKQVSVDEAQDMAAKLKSLCTSSVLVAI